MKGATVWRRCFGEQASGDEPLREAHAFHTRGRPLCLLRPTSAPPRNDLASSHKESALPHGREAVGPSLRWRRRHRRDSMVLQNLYNPIIHRSGTRSPRAILAQDLLSHAASLLRVLLPCLWLRPGSTSASWADPAGSGTAVGST